MRAVLRAAGVAVACSGVLSLSGAAGLPGPDASVLSGRISGDSEAEDSAGYGNDATVMTAQYSDEQASVTVVKAPSSANTPGATPSPYSYPTGLSTFTSTGAAGDLGIPDVVLSAYQRAASRMNTEKPACGMRWEVLAGIGKIESGHANGGRVDAGGDARPRILGPALDGNGFASISDSDGGRWDGDAVWDRAVGPMQFIPGTWKIYGVDGSGDGIADPHNVFDATLAAAGYLCAGGSDLSTDAGLRAALYRYNHSASYVASVMSWIKTYESGRVQGFDSPGPGADVPFAGGIPRPGDPAPGPGGVGGPGGGGGTQPPGGTDRPNPSDPPDSTQKPNPSDPPKPPPGETDPPDPDPDPTVPPEPDPEPTVPPEPDPEPTVPPEPDPDPTEPDPEPTEPDPDPTEPDPDPTDPPAEECPDGTVPSDEGCPDDPTEDPTGECPEEEEPTGGDETAADTPEATVSEETDGSEDDTGCTDPEPEPEPEPEPTETPAETTQTQRQTAGRRR